jgi:hypothetical protein
MYNDECRAVYYLDYQKTNEFHLKFVSTQQFKHQRVDFYKFALKVCLVVEKVEIGYCQLSRDYY